VQVPSFFAFGGNRMHVARSFNDMEEAGIEGVCVCMFVGVCVCVCVCVCVFVCVCM